MVLVCVGVHYEVLSITSQSIRHAPIPHRIRVAAALLAAIVAHMIEVAIFAAAWGALIGAGIASLSTLDPDLIDLLYFSMTTYSSLGYGDIVPTGDSRLLAGVEAVTGLVLIAWTASFTYFEMHEFWDDGDGRRNFDRVDAPTKGSRRRAAKE